MAESRTVALTPSQIGTETASTWTAGTFPIVWVTGHQLGLMVDFSFTRESERNLTLDPDRPYTATAAGTSATLQLDTTQVVAAAADASNVFYFVNQLNRAAYSDAALPTDVGAADLVIVKSSYGGTDWVLQGDGTYSLVLSLDFHANYTDGNSLALRTPVNTYVNQPTWNGEMYFRLDHVGSWGVTAVTFNGQVQPFNTGWDRHKADWGRPLVDQKTGLPSFAPELSEDGYSTGIWTENRSWDPADPRDDEPVQVPDTEGQLDDSVPQ